MTKELVESAKDSDINLVRQHFDEMRYYKNINIYL
jgi:hypothetical protein